MLLVHISSNILLLLIDDKDMKVTLYGALSIGLIHPRDTAARSILMTSATHYGYKP